MLGNSITHVSNTYYTITLQSNDIDYVFDKPVLIIETYHKYEYMLIQNKYNIKYSICTDCEPSDIVNKKE